MIKYILSILVALSFLTTVNFPVSAENDRGPLTKKTFIHHKKSFARPPGAGNGGGGTKCYSFLANGAKWKRVESYKVNPTNNYGLSNEFINQSVLNSVVQWDNASGKDVFGGGSVDINVSYNDNSTDGANTLSFGSYSENNVIAVTNVWGYFGGSPATRELVEWDMLLNTSSNWSWGNASESATLMDVENIIAHELGHAAGLGHPDNSCILETMYAYSSEGETLKRSLNLGDVKGIQELYK